MSSGVVNRAVKTTQAQSVSAEALQQRLVLTGGRPEAVSPAIGGLGRVELLKDTLRCLRQSQVMPLDCQGRRTSILPQRCQRMPRPGRPMIDTPFLALEPELEPLPVFPQIVQQTGNSGFFRSAESVTVSSGAITYALQMIPDQINVSQRAHRVSQIPSPAHVYTPAFIGRRKVWSTFTLACRAFSAEQ